MKVFPADAEVAIDHARAPACNAMAEAAYAAELLGVEMQQFVRIDGHHAGQIL